MSNENSKTTLAFINKVYELAKEKGIAIGELEKKIGKATGYLGRFKNGTIKSMPSAEIMDKLAKELDVSVEYLITNKTNELSKKDDICIRFIQKLTSETIQGNMEWEYYFIEGNEECNDEDIPKCVRDRRDVIKRNYEEELAELNIISALRSFSAYMADIAEIEGKVCLMSYGSREETPTYGPQDKHYLELWFVDDNGKKLISSTEYNKPARTVLEKAIEECYKTVSKITNKVDAGLISKMSLYLDS